MGVRRWDCFICSDLGCGERLVETFLLWGVLRAGLCSQIYYGFDTIVLNQLSAVFGGRVVCIDALVGLHVIARRSAVGGCTKAARPV